MKPPTAHPASETSVAPLLQPPIPQAGLPSLRSSSRPSRRRDFRRSAPPAANRPAKSGQTLIFMSMVVVMIAFAALFYFDVHKILHVKAVSRNAGDAAALSGARWQAISLNLVGSLNVAQALALTDAVTAGESASPESELIAELQRRVAFSGPLFGYVAAQQAAKQNGLFNRGEFASQLRRHADIVENEYPHLYTEEPFTPVDYPTAWAEYAGMLRLMADHGAAVNAAWQYYRHYAHHDHLLLNPAFYDAIAGRSWCWFYFNAYDELQDYEDWRDWEDLPRIHVDPPVNSEVFSLLLRRERVRDSIPTLPSGNAFYDTMEDLRDALRDLEDRDWETYAEVNVDWAWYNGSRWGSWAENIPENFPWDGEIRREYDYAGADAAVGVEAETNRHTDFQGADTVNWSAGAKPFGSLEGGIPPSTVGLVLPAYTDVRLIPIDATMSGGRGQLRDGWIEFIMVYLPRYMEYGPSVLPTGNWYANQLRTWEVDEFREAGVDWLLDRSDSCYHPPSGPGGGSGGTIHGH